MLWATLALLEGMIAAEVIIAYKMDFLLPPASPEKSVLMEHWGIWSDMIVLSPVLALIVGRCWPRWSFKTMLLSGAIGVIVTFVMVSFWRKNPVANCFDYGGRTLPAGWVHATYMIVAVAVLLLFFFATPSDVLSRLATKLIACVFALHVGVSLAAPEYNTFHRVSFRTITVIGIAWVVIAIWWLRLAHSSGR